MRYVDAQENLKSGDVMGLWVDDQGEQIRTVQLSRKRLWNQLVAMPDSSSGGGSDGSCSLQTSRTLNT